MNKVDTWVQLLKQIKVTGAVAFSSDSLAKRMLKRVDFSKAEVIVELGAGTGCITEFIAKRKNPETILLVFEVNKVFCKVLREKFNDPTIYIIDDSAENLETHLWTITGRREVDFIISSLPFSIIHEKVRNNIMKTITRVLTPYSWYIQFGYNKRKYKKLLNSFDTVKTSFVLDNLPPAYVFNCKLRKVLDPTATVANHGWSA